MKTDEMTSQDNSSRLSPVLLLFGQSRGANGNCLFLSMALQVQPEDLKDIPSRPGWPGPMGTNKSSAETSRFNFSRSLRWVELQARRVLCGHGSDFDRQSHEEKLFGGDLAERWKARFS